MKILKSYWALILVLAMSITACRDEFFPKVNSQQTGYLVVEGVMNAGDGPTFIKISRSYPIDSAYNIKWEMNADVSVESNDNSIQNLTMVRAGLYSNPQLSINSSAEYRLRIRTADGKEYVSDYVPVKITPEIDSVSGLRTTAGMDINVSAHDEGGNTRYYRWEFNETWEIRSVYYSSLVYEPDNDIVRNRIFPDEDVFTCWKYDSSTTIIISSTAGLSGDVVSNFRLKTIPLADERLSVRYSILTRQYGMTKEEYEFYDLMKKNTESLGTIFDPMPSEVRGNIHNVNDPNEIVIGYASATFVREKRIFLDDPPNWGFRLSCDTYDVTKDSTAEYYPPKGAFLPLYSDYRGSLIIYPSASVPCVDCTTRGGNTSRPSYW